MAVESSGLMCSSNYHQELAISTLYDGHGIKMEQLALQLEWGKDKLALELELVCLAYAS